VGSVSCLFVLFFYAEMQPRRSEAREGIIQRRGPSLEDRIGTQARHAAG